MDKKFVKNQDSKKVALGPKGQSSKRNNRKGENPMRISPPTEPQGSRFPTTSICRNAACKAVVYDEFSATRFSALGGKEGSVPQIEGTFGAKDVEPDSILKVRDSGKLRQLTWVKDRRGLDDISGPELSGLGHMVKPDTSKADGSPSPLNGLDMNIVIVSDVDDEAAPNDIPREEADHRGGGSENSGQHGPNVEVAAVNSQAGMSRKRPASTEAHDSDSAFVRIAPFPAYMGGPGNLDLSYEYCVVFRKLEREGHITKEFRRKLFTWFSLGSTEHERRVVNTFIRTLGNDPESLGEQLVDSFGNIVNTKRPRT